MVRRSLRADEVGVYGERVVLGEEEQDEEDQAVEELLPATSHCWFEVTPTVRAIMKTAPAMSASRVPRPKGCISGKGQAEQRSNERDGVAEAQDKAVWEWRLGHVLGRGARKGADAVVDADKSVAGEVDAEGDPQEGVGEGFVGKLHY